MTVHRQGGLRKMPLQGSVDRLARRGKLGCVQGALRKVRSVSGGIEDQVTVAQRQGEPLCQIQHHRTTGLGPPGFHKAEVALRYVRVERQFKLAEPATLTPPPL
ncbi:hypothetical protein [Paracoccus suum]|uniref:hypothetical protein n=1 Tax=Paracoccus suum TaxID=2259340 RepID=UPI0018EFFBED|nr:hypothetical protein [Paracoccus suum]